ncbi:MAG: addiction module protein [Planctomycetes bacterium]|nr:addiction module protein [Planctomycetota bacterium]
MAIPLSLEKMTTSEKLAAIELLWDDLRRFPEDISSPDWHKSVLVTREKRVRAGRSSFLDLDEAKSRIAKNIK